MTLAHPLPGYAITTPFNGYPGHRGADYAAPEGTPILAAHDGRVRFSGWDDRGGWMVYLTAPDGSSETSYQHMVNAPSVSPGQRVSAGQVLGRVGTTGYSTGPHLHFEYWVNGLAWQGGTAVDPAPYIDSTPTPQPTDDEEDDDMAKTAGFAYTRAGKQINVLVNPVSGFYHEYEANDGGYNSGIARAFDTGSFEQISEGHARKLEADCVKVRAGEA